MTTHNTILSIGHSNQLSIDYKIYDNVPTITEEEKTFIIDSVLEALFESKGFEENLEKHFQDECEGSIEQ